MAKRTAVVTIKLRGLAEVTAETEVEVEYDDEDDSVDIENDACDKVVPNWLNLDWQAIAPEDDTIKIVSTKVTEDYAT